MPIRMCRGPVAVAVLVVLSGAMLSAPLLTGCDAPAGTLDGAPSAADDDPHAGTNDDVPEVEEVPAPADDLSPPSSSSGDAGADAGASDAGDAGKPKTNQPLLRSGLHPDASDELRALGFTASQITQTIGNAPASAGTHAQDGTVDGKTYGAAVDLSTSGMSETKIKQLLGGLGGAGFVAWYRKPGADGWNGAPHIHAVWTGCKMKLSLRNQVRSWLAGRNGLVSNTTYQFYTWPTSTKDSVRAKFLAFNPATN